MSGLAEALGWFLLAGGGLFSVIGAVGLLRMPDFYTRAHAASVIETLGAGLVLAGLFVQAGGTLAAAKIAILALLIFFASPTATHALTRAALLRGLEPRIAAKEDGRSK